MTGHATSFAGGLLIGLSVTLLMLLNGRIAGISGIVAGLVRRPDERLATNMAFVLCLLAGPLAYRLGAGAWPAVHVTQSLPLVAAAGLLVGFGTRLGSGCTSGHGVAGLARLSPRSFAAVATFLATGVLTVLVMRWVQP